jgi:outer membrane protein OmpA-like peptidoglycan-associated protein
VRVVRAVPVALVLPALVVTVLVAGPAAASAPGGGTARIDPPPAQPGATYPVEAIVFPEGSADGAVMESGNSIDMSADVMFEVDSAELTPRANDELVRVVAELRSTVLTRADVTGYTDSTGSAEHNLALSQARAESVRAVLAAALRPGVAIGAAGKGEAEPVADNATAEGRAMNRRVRITYR